MARTKLTARKATEPKGVPRRQLAPRDEGASSSRPDPQAEMERLSAELAQATRDRATDAIQVGELRSQLRRLTGAHLSCERMMGPLVVERNEAWHREDVARERAEEL
jgi:predicted membrane chloride channel (bestrophin family)